MAWFGSYSSRMPHYFVTLTANDSGTEGMSGICRSVIRPVETTQYFFERFALIKDLLYEKDSLWESHRPLVQN